MSSFKDYKSTTQVNERVIVHFERDNEFTEAFTMNPLNTDEMQFKKQFIIYNTSYFFKSAPLSQGLVTYMCFEEMHFRKFQQDQISMFQCIYKFKKYSLRLYYVQGTGTALHFDMLNW